MTDLEFDIFDAASAEGTSGDTGRIMVKQEFAAGDLCGCEAKNRYRVSVPNGESEGRIFLYVDEDSECVERVCCSVNRSLTLTVHEGSSSLGAIAQKMRKPFHLQGCCFWRPSFEVLAGPTKIGTIEDPFACCEMNQHIMDERGKLLYTTTGSVCQLGLCCPCVSPVDFQIRKDGKEVGSISKRPLTCTECMGKTNRFTVDFPAKASPVEKRLIFSAAMLADLEYFEQNKRDN